MKYLVKPDGLYGPVTILEPDQNDFYEPDYEQPNRLYYDGDSYLRKKKEYAEHLASLPKICRCEGLKDGAIVEENVDFVFEDKYIIGITEDGSAETTSGWRKVAIPLHREQGEEVWGTDGERVRYDLRTVVDCARNISEETIIKRILEVLQDGNSWIVVSPYSLPPSPQSEQAGEKVEDAATVLQEALKAVDDFIKIPGNHFTTLYHARHKLVKLLVDFNAACSTRSLASGLPGERGAAVGRDTRNSHKRTC